LTIDDVKKSEVLKHLMKADKVKMNWLVTVCMVSEEDLRKIAAEYAMEIDNQGYIHTPKKEAIIKEIIDHTKKTEEAENISSYLQPSILETEFSPDVVAYIESIFEKEGFDFKIKEFTIRVEETGITIKKKRNLISKLPWHWIKSIRCTRLRKDDFIFKDDKRGDFMQYGIPLELDALTYLTLADVISTPAEFDKIKRTTHNALILSLEDGNYKQINIYNYKLKQKIPIPDNYDQMVVIIDHFFHKIKREQLELIP